MRRGYAMIVTIAVGLILLLLSLGFLNKRIAEYRGAYQAAYQAQALALARAGMEDARVKLCKDYNFPPNLRDEQRYFSYTEVLLANEESYTVTLDTGYANNPYQVILVSSVGTAGPMANPRARRKIRAELDMAPERPVGTLNPRVGRWVHWQDLGAR